MTEQKKQQRDVARNEIHPAISPKALIEIAGQLGCLVEDRGGHWYIQARRGESGFKLWKSQAEIGGNASAFMRRVWTLREEAARRSLDEAVEREEREAEDLVEKAFRVERTVLRTEADRVMEQAKTVIPFAARPVVPTAPPPLRQVSEPPRREIEEPLADAVRAHEAYRVKVRPNEVSIQRRGVWRVGGEVAKALDGFLWATVVWDRLSMVDGVPMIYMIRGCEERDPGALAVSRREGSVSCAVVVTNDAAKKLKVESHVPTAKAGEVGFGKRYKRMCPATREEHGHIEYIVVDANLGEDLLVRSRGKKEEDDAD